MFVTLMQFIVYFDACQCYASLSFQGCSLINSRTLTFSLTSLLYYTHKTLEAFVLSRTLYRASCEISPARRRRRRRVGEEQKSAHSSCALLSGDEKKRTVKSDAIPAERNNVRREGPEG